MNSVVEGYFIFCLLARTTSFWHTSLFFFVLRTDIVATSNSITLVDLLIALLNHNLEQEVVFRELCHSHYTFSSLAKF